MARGVAHELGGGTSKTHGFAVATFFPSTFFVAAIAALVFFVWGPSPLLLRFAALGVAIASVLFIHA